MQRVIKYMSYSVCGSMYIELRICWKPLWMDFFVSAEGLVMTTEVPFSTTSYPYIVSMRRSLVKPRDSQVIVSPLSMKSTGAVAWCARISLRSLVVLCWSLMILSFLAEFAVVLDDTLVGVMVVVQTAAVLLLFLRVLVERFHVVRQTLLDVRVCFVPSDHEF